MNSFSYTVKDCLVLSGRGAKHLIRRLDTIVTTVVLPIVILLLFVCLFGGAVQTNLGDGVKYINYVLPGILLSAIGYVATTTASSVNDDLTKGLISRLKSMPIARSAFIVGHLFASVIRSIVAIFCVTGVALLLGYRSSSSAADWILAVIILLVFALAMTSIAIVLGLLASGPDAASAFAMPLMFLSYFTDALVPTSTMPHALQVFCANQPMNIVWKAVSGLTMGGMDHSIWSALAWCVGITVFCLVVGGLLFARKSAK